MPAKSKSQQRLFGMVHAYQKGEFHGSRSLRNRVADLARRVSKSDAKHFAQTPHEGLPEKKASEEYAFKGDRVTIFSNIRCRYAGKKATVISTNHDGADKSRQVSVFKTDDGHVFSGYTDAYVATNHTSKAAEKTAQAILRPEDVQRLFAQLPSPDYERLIPERSEARHSVLSSAVHGALAGATIGSLGAGALGGLLGYKGSAGASAGDRAVAALRGALRCGAWGASRGALTGAVTGTGFGIWNKVRS